MGNSAASGPQGAGDEVGQDAARLDEPWARTVPARAARELIICGVLGACMDAYTRRQILGREHLAALEGPVIFVANHASHMDTPAVLRALPGRWRRRTVVAAAADYFYANRGLARIVSLSFGTVPLERKGGGLPTGCTSLLARLIAERWNLVVFAEGTRSRDDSVGRLRSGAAVMAAEHGLAIVPMYVSGTRDAMPTGRYWMRRQAGRGVGRRHDIRIRFGAPVRPLPGETPPQTMERVRLFLQACGARTTPDPRARAMPAQEAPVPSQVA